MVALNPDSGAKERGLRMFVKVNTKLVPATIADPMLVTLNCCPVKVHATVWVVEAYVSEQDEVIAGTASVGKVIMIIPLASNSAI